VAQYVQIPLTHSSSGEISFMQSRVACEVYTDTIGWIQVLSLGQPLQSWISTSQMSIVDGGVIVASRVWVCSLTPLAVSSTRVYSQGSMNLGKYTTATVVRLLGAFLSRDIRSLVAHPVTTCFREKAAARAKRWHGPFCFDLLGNHVFSRVGPGPLHPRRRLPTRTLGRFTPGRW
jgi:hypothetical protein